MVCGSEERVEGIATMILAQSPPTTPQTPSSLNGTLSPMTSAWKNAIALPSGLHVAPYYGISTLSRNQLPG